MKTLYTGKTKDVLLDEATNVVTLLFKDSATGENGVFDPGSNSVGGSVEGKWKVCGVQRRFLRHTCHNREVPQSVCGVFKRAV